MNRFKMVFNNSGSAMPQYNNLSGGLASIGTSPAAITKPRNVALNSPMIDRIHKAKPGCSACGKKVA